jgi:hypothetical protein
MVVTSLCMCLNQYGLLDVRSLHQHASPIQVPPLSAVLTITTRYTHRVHRIVYIASNSVGVPSDQANEPALCEYNQSLHVLAGIAVNRQRCSASPDVDRCEASVVGRWHLPAAASSRVVAAEQQP